MANPKRRHPLNVPGPWFVDDYCANCDASRQCAPEIFGEAGGQAIVVRQPVTDEECIAAARAMLLCPTGSIGVEGQKPGLSDLFPQALEDDVFLCGFNSHRSFGASSYFVKRSSGNFLVDSPRFVRGLAAKLEQAGGVSDIFLTHRDDVADAARYAERFGSRVWIHEDDRSGAPFATDFLKGRAPVDLGGALEAWPLPGHTRGSVAYLFRGRILFSGDSLYYSRHLGTLCVFTIQCWFSLDEQADSLERLGRGARFSSVLPGHGQRFTGDPNELHEALGVLVERMRRRDPLLEGGPSGIPW